MSLHRVISLAIDLLQRPSITPEDKECQTLISKRLEDLGFRIEHLEFGEVDNLFATHGTGKPILVFAGHTDVVPPGPEQQWHHDPFSATIEDGLIYGRGAADMKGSVAAMVCAIEGFVIQFPKHPGQIALMLTSDEEGPAINGIRKVMKHLSDKEIFLDYCVIGEPSSSKILGDTIKVGRRGSMSGNMTIIGKEGHIAYPHLANNPTHALGDVIQTLTKHHWDHGNAFFPATSFQISNIHAGEGTGNVIPGEVKLNFNFRYSSQLNEQRIQKQTHELLDSLNIEYAIDWEAFGKPFITEKGKLIEAVRDQIKSVTDIDTELSTSGGTSDGRFIAPTGTEVIELGPINSTIHKINENVRVDDLIQLSEIYTRICIKLLNH